MNEWEYAWNKKGGPPTESLQQTDLSFKANTHYYDLISHYGAREVISHLSNRSCNLLRNLHNFRCTHSWACRNMHLVPHCRAYTHVFRSYKVRHIPLMKRRLRLCCIYYRNSKRSRRLRGQTLKESFSWYRYFLNYYSQVNLCSLQEWTQELPFFIGKSRRDLRTTQIIFVK